MDLELWELVAKYRTGQDNLQEEAAEEIVLRIRPRLFYLLLSLTKDEHTAKDLLSATLVKIFENIWSLEPTGSFLAWCLRIAYREFLKEWQSWRRRNIDFVDEETMNLLVEASAGGENPDVELGRETLIQTPEPCR